MYYDHLVVIVQFKTSILYLKTLLSLTTNLFSFYFVAVTKYILQWLSKNSKLRS
jgi:hypothetical protein